MFQPDNPDEEKVQQRFFIQFHFKSDVCDSDHIWYDPISNGQYH
jgi:hypothetical protein